MKVIAPGGIIGVLGSGQLGRMFAIEARQMGYRVHTLSPGSDTPAGQVSDVETNADWDDDDAVRAFAREVDVVTFEFENVPANTVAVIEALTPVRPDGSLLYIAQNRIREKEFLRQEGLPTAPFRVVRDREGLDRALEEIGCPAVLKTADSGYDGKGQFIIHSTGEMATAWDAIGGTEAVLEALIELECEVSVVAARGLDGEFVHYGATENQHRSHILDVTIAPAGVSAAIAAQAVEITRVVMEKLRVVGVLCVEFFVASDGKLMVNELAPRPHNSGHFTLDACVTSQFEQQLRAVCGLPLGSTRQFQPAAMANLLGDVWDQGEPNWAAVCRHEDVKLHLYGKNEPRPGRKMGHLTAVADQAMAARSRVLEARASLSPRAGR